MTKNNNKEIQEAEARIIKWIPEKERKVAKELIYRAVKKGCTNIGILPPPKFEDHQYEATIRDMVGDGPDGKFYFLYGKV